MMNLVLNKNMAHMLRQMLEWALELPDPTNSDLMRLREQSELLASLLVRHEDDEMPIPEMQFIDGEWVDMDVRMRVDDSDDPGPDEI